MAYLSSGYYKIYYKNINIIKNCSHQVNLFFKLPSLSKNLQSNLPPGCNCSTAQRGNLFLCTLKIPRVAESVTHSVWCHSSGVTHLIQPVNPLRQSKGVCAYVYSELTSKRRFFLHASVHAPLMWKWMGAYFSSLTIAEDRARIPRCESEWICNWGIDPHSARKPH